MNLKKIPMLRDPLLHFALIGGLLFALDAWVNDGGIAQEDIVITSDRIEHLAAVYERSWQRPPDTEEMQKLLDNYVREEVLYREALKLGLEADDTVIRRRLRLKMEFLARDLVDAVEPPAEVLQQYFHAHAERYQTPAQLSFRQVYFSHDLRAAAFEDAASARAQLDKAPEAAPVGDPHLMPRTFDRATVTEVDAQLGAGFAEQLRQQPRGRWVGPVRSEFGAHLVFIEEFVAPATAEFASVRAKVLRDWQAQAHAEVLEEQYQRLRQAYRVRVQGEQDSKQSATLETPAEVAAR